MQHSRRLLTAACASIALLGSACAPISSVTIGTGDYPSVHSDRDRHRGPPPHAPAHGHRHKHRHQGHDLEFAFDSDLGVYIVIGVPDRYYWNGHYLRIDGDQWYASVNLDSGWERCSHDSLPPGLTKHKKHRTTHHGKHNGKSYGKPHGKSKKSHPAKGHW